MKNLSDEILNKYIDGDLDGKSIAEVKEILNGSEEDMKRLRELQAIDRGLKHIKEYKVRDNFTVLVMERIRSAAKLKKSDRRFILAISSVLVIIGLAILAYLVYLIIPEIRVSGAANSNVDAYADYFVNRLLSLTKLFNSQNISIIGSVFSLGLLISGYFFFETQRQNKRRMNKFN